VVGKTLPPRRPDGLFVLGNIDVGEPVPARAFPDAAKRSDYTVGSTLGISMIIGLGGAAGTYKEATFIHSLVGSPR
jgi:hypothetical protein